MAEHEKHEESSEGGHGGHGGGHGAGGGAHEEAHEGAPEWLISFADNVALMMGFFVILLAMNMAKLSTAGGSPKEKQIGGHPSDLDFVIAIRSAFNPIDMTSDNQAEAALRKRIREKALEAERSRQPEDPGKGKESSAIRPTDLSTLGGTIDFEDESSTLSGKGQKRAEEIGAKLKGTRFIVEVRGNASPSETYRQFEKGIALSHARALAVARVLVAQGIRGEQLRIVACADNERKKGRVYDDSDRENQRVNIVPTNDPAPDYTEPVADDTPKAPKNEASAPAGQEPGGHE